VFQAGRNAWAPKTVGRNRREGTNTAHPNRRCATPGDVDLPFGTVAPRTGGVLTRPHVQVGEECYMPDDRVDVSAEGDLLAAPKILGATLPAMAHRSL